MRQVKGMLEPKKSWQILIRELSLKSTNKNYKPAWSRNKSVCPVGVRGQFNYSV